MGKTAKTAYVSPPNGELNITLIRDANPRVAITLDLGIPNFTVFSMNLPLAEDEPSAMSQLISEAIHVLLDEVASFMLAMEYEEQIIVNLYATVLATFKTMSGEADTSKDQDAAGQDPTVKTFEGTFNMPMDFINETQKRVVTASTQKMGAMDIDREGWIVPPKGEFFENGEGEDHREAALRIVYPELYEETFDSGAPDQLLHKAFGDCLNAGNIRVGIDGALGFIEAESKETASRWAGRIIRRMPVVLKQIVVEWWKPRHETFTMDLTEAEERFASTAATKIQRQPKIRHLELTYSPKEKIKPSDTARVIRQYRSRSLKQQPKPMFVIVYDQMGRATGTIPVGSGKNFKNELLKAMKKGSVDFTAPVSFVNEQEMKSAPLTGIPRTVSVGGMTYHPEAISGGDMALYHGPQDYIVKFPDGRSQVFPGRPTFGKMRTLNFPVPRNRYKWTMIPEEALQQPENESPEAEQPPMVQEEEIKEASPEEGPELALSKDTVQPDQVAKRNGNTIYLKPTKTFDDLVSGETLKKRLERDKLSGKPILEGLMIVDRIGHYGTFEGKSVIVIPQYYVRRHGVQRDDGTYIVYHLRGDGKAQKVGFRPLTPEDFIGAKPVQSSI